MELVASRNEDIGSGLETDLADRIAQIGSGKSWQHIHRLKLKHITHPLDTLPHTLPTIRYIRYPIRNHSQPAKNILCG